MTLCKYCAKYTPTGHFCAECGKPQKRIHPRLRLLLLRRLGEMTEAEFDEMRSLVFAELEELDGIFS